MTAAWDTKPDTREPRGAPCGLHVELGADLCDSPSLFRHLLPGVLVLWFCVGGAGDGAEAGAPPLKDRVSELPPLLMWTSLRACLPSQGST